MTSQTTPVTHSVGAGDTLTHIFLKDIDQVQTERVNTPNIFKKIHTSLLLGVGGGGG